MEKKLKKVLVTLADEKYLPMVTPLENGAKILVSGMEIL